MRGLRQFLHFRRFGQRWLAWLRCPASASPGKLSAAGSHLRLAWSAAGWPRLLARAWRRLHRRAVFACCATAGKVNRHTTDTTFLTTLLRINPTDILFLQIFCSWLIDKFIETVIFRFRHLCSLKIRGNPLCGSRFRSQCCGNPLVYRLSAALGVKKC